MDGDIQVAEQLGKEADQCLASLARKMHLYQSEFDLLQKQEASAEEEERELLQCIKELKDLELVYNREAEDAHKKLVQKGVQFQELTRQASERLSVRALQQETLRLRALIGELQAEEARLSQETGASPPWDAAAVPALLAKSRALQKAFQELSAEHGQVCGAVRDAMAAAGAARAPRQMAEAEDKYCRLLEEAIEDMTLLQVEMELNGAGRQDNDGQVSAEAAGATTTQAALHRLALLRDEYDSQAGKLSASLGARVASNRQLARELGLLDELGDDARLDRSSDHADPDSTTQESPNPNDRPAAAHVGADNIVGDPRVAAAEVAVLSAPPRQREQSDSRGADCARL